MLNFLYFSLITLSVLIIQVHTISFKNNLPLDSNILSQIFFDHLQNKSLPVSTRDLDDSEKCILGLREIFTRYPSLDALPFIDAWGKIPSGLLYGHLQDLGNFDECIEISTNLNELVGHTNGKYCFASLPLLDNSVMKPRNLEKDQAQARVYDNLITLNIGICVPDVCDPDTLTKLFKEANIDSLNGVLDDMYVENCMTAEKPSIEAINIIGIVIFSTFGLLMVLSTLYDLYTNKLNKKPKELYLAFSVLTNGRNLFKISNSKSEKNVDCLTGMRVLSMIWIVFCHSYSMIPLMPIINKFNVFKWFKAAYTMNIILATVSVDTFFFLSGFLISWLGFRELDKTNGKLNISLMYIHRYLRLTPPVAAVMLYILSIEKYVGIGPLKESYQVFSGNCKENWWSTLLYIQNYANPLDICVKQTWYLGADTQLYFLSPLVLIPLWRWGKKFVPVLFLTSLLAIGYIIAVYFHKGFYTFMGVVEDDQLILTYSPTHTRFPVWLIGIGLGYYMHTIKNKSIRLSKLTQILGWSMCFALIFAAIYGPYFTINSDRRKTVLEAALYESLVRVTWGVAISWIVFACHLGYGGLINSFLSHKLWQPICRLSYSMYLVHLNVISANYGMAKSDVYFSDYSMVLIFWGAFGVSLMASVILTLAFEAPVLVIEKSFFRCVNKEIDKKIIATSKTQLETPP